MGTTAVIYTRMSHVRDGDTTKTDRQEQLCRELAARRGWDVTRVFTDNSVSAWKRGVRRPGWEAMLDWVQAGLAGAIVVYHGDRLARQPRDLEQLIDLACGKGIRLASVTGDRDLSSQDDLFILRVEVAAQCRESAATSRRVTAMHERRRRDGLVRGGGRGGRPFGYERGGIVIVPAEADLLREACRRITAGESSWAVAKDFAARGVTTTAGTPVNSKSLRRTLSKPRYAGLMPGGDSPAAWPAILERGDWERLQAVLDGRGAWNPAPTSARRHLLSGIAECGVAGCDGRMRVLSNGRQDGYACRKCFGVFRSVALLDAYVTGRVLARLANPANPAPSPAADAFAAEWEALAAERREIEAVLAVPGRGSVTALMRRLDGVDARMGQLRERAGDGHRAGLRARYAGLTAGEFGLLDLAARRALIAACYRVIILPASRKGRGFDPDAVLMSPL